MKEEIQKVLQKIIEDFGISEISVQIDVPENPLHGDYTSNIAFTAFGKNQNFKNPRQLAEKIKEKFTVHGSQFTDKVEVAGSGFINFFVSKDALLQNLSSILEKKSQFGSTHSNFGKTIVVEYSSPNIAKPFTVGHLRSTIIGDAIANLLQATGATVKRDNHLGDWGTQFGKQIYAIKTWGNEEKIENSQNPVKELVALYVKFHEEAEKNPELEIQAREWFKKLEDGDPEARRLWKKCIDWSMIEFERLYKILGVTFTENNGLGFGESFFEDKMQPIIDELKEKKLLKQDNGAQLVFFEHDKYPPLMIIKSDGATLYATRDLATDKFRIKKYGNDITIINEVGMEQSLYFNQLFETEKKLGWFADGQRIHIGHGHYRFADAKMSTRRGNVIWLEDIISEAKKRAAKLSKNTVEDPLTVAIGALKWNDLKRGYQQDIVFDWDDILNMQGNSGPYLQYTAVRCKSILRKAEISNAILENEWKMNPEEFSLLRHLVHFPEVIQSAAEKYFPNFVCTYLFELAQKFNLFYQKYSILTPSENSNLKSKSIRDFRLQLTAAVGQTLENGLNLVEIKVPEKM